MLKCKIVGEFLIADGKSIENSPDLVSKKHKRWYLFIGYEQYNDMMLVLEDMDLYAQ